MTAANLKPEIAKNVVRAIHSISKSPCHYIKKMKASNSGHPISSLRIRRDVQALLSILDTILVIHVLEVEHRKHSYRDF